MKTITSLKAALVAVCAIGLNAFTLTAGEIKGPAEKEWIILDMETQNKIPYINGQEAGDFQFKTSPWWSEVTVITDNPNKTGYFNDSEKALKWEKSQSWGSVGLEVYNAEDYLVLSEWEELAIDVLVDGSNIVHYKIALYAGDREVGSIEDFEQDKPADEWWPIQISFDDLTNENGKVKLTADDKVTQVKIFINGYIDDPQDVYFDNFRLTRSEVNSIADNKVSSSYIINDPAAGTVKVEGAKGAIRFYSIQGVEVNAIENYNGEDISVSHLATGVYFIKTADHTFKFIKK